MEKILKTGLTIVICFIILLTGCGKKPNEKAQGTNEASLRNSLKNEDNKKNADSAKIKLNEDSKAKADQTSPSTIQNLRFVVMADSRGSDNGVNSSVIKRIMTEIKRLSLQPEFAIMPGDLVDGAESYEKVKSQLEYFKKIITKYYPAEFFYTGVGNHETANGVNGEQALGEVFGEFKATFLKGYNRSVYYFDKGSTRFFMLNSDHPGDIGSISEPQLNWVKENIKSDFKHNLYFFHEPAYPTGPHAGSSLDSHPLERDRLWQIIDESNSPMVFCGHEHFYSRRHINSDFNESIKGLDFKYTKNIYQVTVGSFGAPLYEEYTDTKNVDIPPISQYHFAVVDVNDDKIKTTVFNINGEIIDSFDYK